MYLAINKTDARNYIKKELIKLNITFPDRVKFVQPNMDKRKWPQFIMLQSFDMTGMNGDIDCWCVFFRLTKDTQRKVIKHAFKSTL